MQTRERAVDSRNSQKESKLWDRGNILETTQNCEVASKEINEVQVDNWFDLHFESNCNMFLKTKLKGIPTNNIPKKQIVSVLEQGKGCVNSWPPAVSF